MGQTGLPFVPGAPGRSTAHSPEGEQPVEGCAKGGAHHGADPEHEVVLAAAEVGHQCGAKGARGVDGAAVDGQHDGVGQEDSKTDGQGGHAHLALGGAHEDDEHEHACGW